MLTTEQVKLWKQTAEVVKSNASDMAVKILQERIIALAEELLAVREAQPVGYTSKRNLANVTGRHLELFSKDPAVYSDPVALYTAPPAPAVPDIKIQKAIMWLDGVIQSNPGMKEAVTCRAAMLGCAK